MNDNEFCLLLELSNNGGFLLKVDFRENLLFHLERVNIKELDELLKRDLRCLLLTRKAKLIQFFATVGRYYEKWLICLDK